jgi:truncated hemoglobin YjbI
MDKPSAEPQLTMRFSLQEMRQAEAREWILRYQQKIKELGKEKATAWWQATIADIARRRGEVAADDLRKRMNEIRRQG